MIKKVIFIMLFCVANGVFAQVKLEGIVKDSIGAPLELANVIAINQETKTLQSYGITDKNGLFRLSLSKNATFSLQVSYIGMKTHTESITTKEINIDKDIVKGKNAGKY